MKFLMLIHFVDKKTIQRIKYSFFSPTIMQDIKRFRASCKECQLKRTVTYRDWIQIQSIVWPKTLFEIWSMGSITLKPSSVCDIYSWSLHHMDRSRSCQRDKCKDHYSVLMKIFTQISFSKMIWSDKWTNFTVKLPRAFEHLLGVPFPLIALDVYIRSLTCCFLYRALIN